MPDVEKIICQGCGEEVTDKITFGYGYCFICSSCGSRTFCEKDGTNQYCLKDSSPAKQNTPAQ